MRALALAALVLLLVAGGGDEPVQEQRPAAPRQLDPIVIQVDGGSSVGEWAALVAGVASILGALEVLRRRRRGRL